MRVWRIDIKLILFKIFILHCSDKISFYLNENSKQ